MRDRESPLSLGCVKTHGLTAVSLRDAVFKTPVEKEVGTLFESLISPCASLCRVPFDSGKETRVS